MIVFLALGALAAGAVSGVTGFGIGSLLTPLLAWEMGTRLAVPLVALPHALGTALRLWMLRKDVDRQVLWGFGVLSAAAGLAGAVLYAFLDSPILAIVLGILLIFAGITGLTGLANRIRFRRGAAWIAGAVSGALGGLVGNQGGIRAAALLGFDLSKKAFVATATAIALLVDGVRTPIYLLTQGNEIAENWQLVLIATAGVLLGTLVGEKLLRRIPESLFRRLISALLVILGVFMLFLRR